MTLWLILAAMTAAAVLAILWPLSRSGASRSGGSEVAVYRDQLEELERDRATGLVGAPEAEAARVEIVRRLLAAADAEQSAKTGAGGALRRRRVVALATVLIVPLAALAIYAKLGSPALPGEPLSVRLQSGPQDRSIQTLVAQVEAHLERNPQEGRGWEVLAPVYMRLGRYEDATKARANALRLNGPTATREAEYGEALVAAANGVVTVEANAAFGRALQLEPKSIKARYFLGLAAEQDGRSDRAAAIWHDLIAEAPAGAPWVEAIRESLARLEPGATPAPAEADANVKSPVVAAMPPEQRSDVIRDMVQRLADRLRREGGDVGDWQQLIRSYVVLGEREKATAAASEARQALSADADKVRQINDFSRNLGLDG
jgi:cytochrome c-type biogenesis protein CcmH